MLVSILIFWLRVAVSWITCINHCSFFARVDDNLTLYPLQSRLQQIYRGHRQRYSKVDLNTLPESALFPSQGLWIWPLYSPELHHHARVGTVGCGADIELAAVIEQPGGTNHWATLHTDTYKLYAHPLGADVDILLLLRLYKLVAGTIFNGLFPGSESI